MIRERRAALAAIVLLVAACGGGATTSPVPTGGNSQGAGSSQGAASDPPATAAPPSQDASASNGGGGGGGGAADACALLTPEEVGGVLDASGVTAQGTPGEVSYCMFSSADGDLLAATSYVKQGGRQVFDAWSGASDTIPVDGVGDDATFDPNSATLFMVVGERLVGITAGDGSASQDDRLAWATELGVLVSGRA